MSKGNTYENDWMKLFFQGTAIANLAQNAATGPLTNLFFSLHTADPGEAGTQTTSEVSYGGYARVAKARTATGFGITNNVASPIGLVTFAQRTNTGTATVTFFGVGSTGGAGAGKLFYSGTVTPNIVITQNVTPRLTTGSTITED